MTAPEKSKSVLAIAYLLTNLNPNYINIPLYLVLPTIFVIVLQRTFSPWPSDSQPGCCKEVSDVPPNLDLLPFIFVVSHKVPPIFLNQKKRVKNTALASYLISKIALARIYMCMPVFLNRCAATHKCAVKFF